MDKLEAKLQALFEKNHIAGMSVALTDRDKTVKCFNFGVETVEFPTHKTTEHSMYRLASLVAEKQTGKLFSELAETYILEPLGIDKTTFDIRKAITYPISLPHEEDASGELNVFHYMKENAARYAAGGLYSSSSELCKLARFLLAGGVNANGKRIVSEASMQEMFTPHALVTDKEAMHYGLTLFMRNHDNHFTLGHIGSAPPYATSLFVEPESGYGVVTLMNIQRDELRYEVPDLVFEELAGRY